MSHGREIAAGAPGERTADHHYLLSWQRGDRAQRAHICLRCEYAYGELECLHLAVGDAGIAASGGGAIAPGQIRDAG